MQQLSKHTLHTLSIVRVLNSGSVQARAAFATPLIPPVFWRHVKIMWRLDWQKKHSEIQHPSKETPDATPSDVWSVWWPYTLIPCPKSDRNTRCVPGNLPALLLRQKRRCPCACLSQECQNLREHTLIYLYIYNTLYVYIYICYVV